MQISGQGLVNNGMQLSGFTLRYLRPASLKGLILIHMEFVAGVLKSE